MEFEKYNEIHIIWKINKSVLCCYLATKFQSPREASRRLTLMEDARNFSNTYLLYLSSELCNTFPRNNSNTGLPILSVGCQSGKALCGETLISISPSRLP